MEICYHGLKFENRVCVTSWKRMTDTRYLQKEVAMIMNLSLVAEQLAQVVGIIDERYADALRGELQPADARAETLIKMLSDPRISSEWKREGGLIREGIRSAWAEHNSHLHIAEGEKPMKVIEAVASLKAHGYNETAEALRGVYRAVNDKDVETIQFILWLLSGVRTSIIRLRVFMALVAEHLASILLEYQIEQMCDAEDGFAESYNKIGLAKTGAFNIAMDRLQEARGVFFYHVDDRRESLPNALEAIGRLFKNGRLPTIVGEYLGQTIVWDDLSGLDDKKAGLAIVYAITADKRPNRDECAEESHCQGNGNGKQHKSGKTPEEIRAKKRDRAERDRLERAARKGGSSGGKKNRH